MELLVLKTGDNYIRITDSGVELTGMNKATVFPLSDKDTVMKEYQNHIQNFTDLKIKKLTITESNYP